MQDWDEQLGFAAKKWTTWKDGYPQFKYETSLSDDFLDRGDLGGHEISM